MRFFLWCLSVFLCTQAGWSQQRCLSPSEPSHLHQRQITADTLLSIPIVFHILFRDSSQWISREQVSSQLDVLNQDFQRQNADTFHTPAVFNSVASDCQIAFCLASSDPLGNPSNGINYLQIEVPEIGLSDRYFQSSLGGQSIWNPLEYLNVWICEIDFDGSVGGFAVAASSEFTVDEGIVIDYRFFGLGGTALAPFDRGRTLTHEVGHYLGLMHIWGDSASCLSDDGLADTPAQAAAYQGCPQAPQFSCDSEDMFMNFMDLTDDACMNLFTADQKQLMRSVLLLEKPGFFNQSDCRLSVKATESTFRHLRIAPNPVGRLIHLPLPLQDCWISSIAGRRQKIADAAISLDVTDLPAGLYWMTGSYGSEQYWAYFVKM